MKKRFPPSKKKLKKAHEEGDIPKAPEITALCVVWTGLLGLFGFFLFLQQNWEIFHNFQSYQQGSKDRAAAALIGVCIFVIVLLVGLLFVSVAAEMLQVGWFFKAKQVKGLSVINGLKRLFGLPTSDSNFSIYRTPIWEGFKFSLAVICIVIALMSIPTIGFLSRVSDPTLELLFWSIASNLTPAILGYSILAIFSYLAQRAERRSRLMMDVEELKKELRDNEGREEIKQKRHEAFLELVASSERAAVKKAKLVITGGT